MEELAVGTRVEHPRYGEGIISKNKITSYEIFFEHGGKIELTKRNEDLEVKETPQRNLKTRSHWPKWRKCCATFWKIRAPCRN